MITNLRWLVLILTVNFLVPTGVNAQFPWLGGNGKTLSDQPKEQQSTVRKIVELGGDFEGSSKTVLVGFYGQKFTNETFKYLTPLVDVEHLLFMSIPADDDAFVHCKNLKAVGWLQISSCKFNGTGLKHLSKCKKLSTIYIDDTPVTDECLEILATFESLEVLDISPGRIPSKLTSKGVGKLTALKKLQYLHLDMAEFSPDFENTMKAQLPNCKISLNQESK